jgi:hypothetical protein
MFDLPMDPQILCAVVRLPRDGSPYWEAARRQVETVSDPDHRALLLEDLELLEVAVSGQAPGMYNFFELAGLTPDRMWIASRVGAEPEENDAGGYELVVRLQEAGVVAAAGLSVTVSGAAQAA